MLRDSFKNGVILTIENCPKLTQINMGRESWTLVKDQGIEGAKMRITMGNLITISITRAIIQTQRMVPLLLLNVSLCTILFSYCLLLTNIG